MKIIQALIPPRIFIAAVAALVGLTAWDLFLADRVQSFFPWQGPAMDFDLAWIKLPLLIVIAMGSFALIRRRVRITQEVSPIDNVNQPNPVNDLQLARLARCQIAGQIGCWDYDPATKKIWWSDETCRLLGFEPSEAEPDFDFVLSLTHQDDREKLMDVTFRAITEKTDYDINHRILRNDGIEINVHARGEVVCDADGNVIRIDGTVQDITERVRADHELKRSEFLLAEAQRIAHLGTWDYNIANDSLWWSDETYRLFGHEPNSFTPTAEKLIETVHPDDREFAESQISKCVSENAPLSYDHRIVRPDGTVRHVHEQGELFFDDRGNLVRTTGTVLDITERKRIERELQQAHDEMEKRVAERTEQVQRQAELIDQVNDTLISTDETGVIDSWNRGAERMFGYSPDAILGQNVSILYSDDSRSDISADISNRLRSSDAMELDVPFIREDGTGFTGQISLTAIRINDGMLVGITGHISDVTERRAAERALAESERNLRGLTNLSPVGIYRSDRQGRLTYVNERWLSLIGLDSEEAIGDGWISAIHPDDREGAISKWQSFIKTGAPYENEGRVVRRDGSELWLYSQATREYDADGNLVGYVGTITDITGRKAAEQALAESEERFRAITETSSDITVIFDEQGHYTYVSPATMRSLGYKREEFIGSGPTKFIHPDDNTQFERVMDKAKNNPGKTFHIPEVRAVSAQGNVRHFEILITGYPDNKGIRGTVANARDVTERVGIEKRLREREQHLTNLARLSPSGIFQTDGDGVVTYVNERWCQIFQIDARNALHQGWVTALHPDDRDQALATWRRSIVMREPYVGEFRIVKPDGGISWIFAQALPELDGTGKIVGYVGSALDLTERKQAEHKAETARAQAERIQKRLNDAIESFTEGFALFDAEDRIVVCNEAYKSNFLPIAKYLEPGVQFEDFLRAMYNSDEILPKKFRSEENFQRRLDLHRNPESGPWTAPTEDGRWFMVHEYRTHEGGIALIRADITNRVEAEQALADSEANLKTLTQLSPVGIFRTNTDGQIIYINEKWRQITGLERDLGMGDDWALSLHPDDRAQVMAEWNDAVRRDQDYAGEFRMVTPKGEERWVYSQATPERDENGRSKGYVGTVTNIDGQKSAEKDLVEARKLAEAASKAKSEFLASMSHELRTPLNAVLGFAQLLERGNGNLTLKDHKNYVDEILRSGSHLLDLVNDVLDLEKIESGHMPLEIQSRELKPMLDNCLKMVGDDARESGIKLVSHMPDQDDAMVRVDELRFKQTLLNLLSNAVKYNSPNGEIVVDYHHSLSGGIRISVTDTGEGIPSGMKDKVFEPFERLGIQNSSTPGTGIGLSIARELIESMGGTIGYESVVGKGSTFWVELPSADQKLH